MSHVLRRKPGKNLPGLIRDLAASSKIASVLELLANSHDADAEHVRVVCDLERDVLEIRDDGEGMTVEDGLPAFYALGDSPKVQNPVTPKGRHKIGKFGIGSISVADLAASYVLITDRSGKRTIVEETLEDELSLEKELPYRETPISPNLHGTTITMHGLKLRHGSDFDVRELGRAIRWELPIALPDFSVELNSQEIRMEEIPSVRKYEIDKRLKAAGHVRGTFFYAARAHRQAGVHVYVNGRRVGNPRQFVPQRTHGGLTGKVIGIVHADDLDSAVVFDRGRLKEDHVGVIALREHLKKVYSGIENDVYRQNRQLKAVSAADAARRVLREMETQVNEVLGELRPAQGLSLHIVPSAELLKQSGGTDGFAHFSRKEGRLFFNEGDPFLTIDPERFELHFYRLHLAQQVADALAYDCVIRDHGTIRSFLEQRRQLLERILAPSVGEVLSSLEEIAQQRPLVQAVLNDLRMYSRSELSQLTTRPIGLIHHLVDAGALRQDGEHIKGSGALHVLRQADGFTSLYEIVTQIFHERESGNVTLNYRSATQQVATYTDERFPFIRNLGTKEPCFFVQDEFTEPVTQILRRGDLNLRQRATRKDNPLRPLYDEFVTSAEAAERLQTSAREIGLTLRLARDHGLPLDTKPGEDGTKMFRYALLAAAYRERQQKVR